MNSFNLIEFILNNFKDILYMTGVIASFFVGRKTKKANEKKAVAQAQSIELDNVEAALKIYRTMLEDMKHKLEEAEAAYSIIEARYHSAIESKKALIAENIELKRKLNEVSSNR